MTTMLSASGSVRAGRTSLGDTIIIETRKRYQRPISHRSAGTRMTKTANISAMTI